MPIQLDPSRLYHGVYPGGATGTEDDVTDALVNEYEQAAGRKAAWVYFSHNWYNGSDFPRKTADWIHARGSLPFIRLMLRSDADNPCPDPTYTLKAINDGRFDKQLRKWGDEALAFGSPLVVEWGTEMNGDWFAWNAKWNGKEKGATRFKNAFQRIVRIIRDEAQAKNVTWVFHANNGDAPKSSWNRVESYYPEDAYVDWLGMSVYGAQKPKQGEECLPFAPRMKAIYNRLTAVAPTKPIFLLEFGATSGHPQAGVNDLCKPDKWADSALRDILTSRSYAQLRGFSWWNERWQNNDGSWTDMRLQATPALRDVFRQHLVGNPKIIDRPIYTEPETEGENVQKETGIAYE
jgi:hypothetical protein